MPNMDLPTLRHRSARMEVVAFQTTSEEGLVPRQHSTGGVQRLGRENGLLLLRFDRDEAHLGAAGRLASMSQNVCRSFVPVDRSNVVCRKAKLPEKFL
jgi:hypothetical protein